MFYEELPAERKAIRRLFQILSDKIRQELQVSIFFGILRINVSWLTNVRVGLETTPTRQRSNQPPKYALRIRRSKIPG